MDFKRLDEIVENFVRNNKQHVETLPVVTDYSKQVLIEQYPNFNNEWSRQIDLNDSINTIYKFLETVDLNMANQFLNIIKSDSVNILPKNMYPDKEDEVRDGKVFIYYENTPNDAFIILHEILHKMNECNIITDNNEQTETFTRDYFGESVSILGENMLGNYMVENGFINENDFNIRKAKRLNDSKENARDIIVENELIKLKLQGKEISYENLINLINNYDSNTVEYRVLNDEKNDLRRISSILKNNRLNTIKSERYVIAQVISNDMLKRDTLFEDFVKLHYEVGNPNSNINDVYNDIILKENVK